MPEHPYVADYRSRHESLYRLLATRIAELMKTLCDDAQIPVVQIEQRSKSPASVAEKIERKSYSDPANDLCDLAGVRIITYYNDDVTKVAEIVRREFEVDADRSTDKMDELEVDEFGYRSFHLVASIRSPRSNLVEWKSLRGLKFEIQIRSALQHAWAAMSHKLDYKRAAQAPSEVRRQLFRLSALLELADDEFKSLRDRTRAIAGEYKADVVKGDLEIPLNIDSLIQYLDERGNLSAWSKVGVAAGMEEMDSPTDEGKSLYLRRLFNAFEVLGLKSIDAVHQELQLARPGAVKVAEKIAAAARAAGYTMAAVHYDVIATVILVRNAHKLPKSFEVPESWHYAAGIRTGVQQLIDAAAAKKT